MANRWLVCSVSLGWWLRSRAWVAAPGTLDGTRLEDDRERRAAEAEPAQLVALLDRVARLDEAVERRHLGQADRDDAHGAERLDARVDEDQPRVATPAAQPCE